MAIKLDFDQLIRLKERSREINSNITTELSSAIYFIYCMTLDIKNDRMTTALNGLKTKSEEAHSRVKENLEALVTFLEKQIADYSELSEEASSKFQSVSEKLDSINFD